MQSADLARSFARTASALGRKAPVHAVEQVVEARDIEARVGNARILNQQQYCRPRLGCPRDHDLDRALIAYMQVGP